MFEANVELKTITTPIIEIENNFEPRLFLPFSGPVGSSKY
jgi:hypothetical protein